jgi:hypothetical protein
MVGPGRSWPSPAEGWRAIPFLHRARDPVVKDQQGTMLQEEPRKCGRSERDVLRNGNAKTTYETEA